jgi:hypothetical protein
VELFEVIRRGGGGIDCGASQVERGTPEETQCHLGQEESSQSKRGLRTRPLLLSRLSAMRPPWSASVPLPW